METLNNKAGRNWIFLKTNLPKKKPMPPQDSTTENGNYHLLFRFIEIFFDRFDLLNNNVKKKRRWNESPEHEKIGERVEGIPGHGAVLWDQNTVLNFLSDFQTPFHRFILLHSSISEKLGDAFKSQVLNSRFLRSGFLYISISLLYFFSLLSRLLVYLVFFFLFSSLIVYLKNCGDHQ